MRIIIDTDKDRITNLSFEDADDGQATYENITAIIFCILENLTLQVKDSLTNKADINGLWEYVGGACDQLCLRCFPDDPSEAGFELSDAALIYAEDMIIQSAEKKGMTFEEALKEYEDKAKAYVAERSGVLNS